MLLQQALDTLGCEINVVCTQPRKISAISLCTRVSQEMCDGTKGGFVGYQVRLDSNTCSSTRLTFCTTGILLRRLQSDPLLLGVTHVVVDEIHERTIESDFLLYLLRSLVMQRQDLRYFLRF